MTVINGFFTNACLPLSYEILAETTFPNSEALSAGLVHGLYSVLRLILKGLNKLLDQENNGVKSYSYSFIMILLLFSSFVLMFFAKIRHRRLRIEVRAAKKEQKEQKKGRFL
jgi:hypothetical protein